MRLVEIAGHLIDPGKVSYVGPIREHFTLEGISEFKVIVDGERMYWQFAAKTVTRNACRELICAIESAQPACCVSWPKHSVPSDALVGVECAPEMRGTFRDGKFVREMKVEGEEEPPKCRLRINTMRGESFVVDVKEMKPG